jgi:hypothetical protein
MLRIGYVPGGCGASVAVDRPNLTPQLSMQDGTAFNRFLAQWTTTGAAGDIDLS